MRDPQQVECYQDQAQIMLGDYIRRHFPGQQVRFGKLLLMLPSLRMVNPKTIEELFFRQTIGSVAIESLLCDMFKSSWRKQYFISSTRKNSPRLLQAFSPGSKPFYWQQLNETFWELRAEILSKFWSDLRTESLQTFLFKDSRGSLLVPKCRYIKEQCFGVPSYVLNSNWKYPRRLRDEG